MSPINQIITLDFETFYDPKFYTLRKMTTEEYVRDPRFKVLALGYATDTGSGWIPPEGIKAFLRRFDWSSTAVMCHHAAFDGLILSHHYNIRPTLFLCTLSMARAWWPDEPASLEAIAKAHSLGCKTASGDQFDGHHAEVDCELTRSLFQLLIEQGFPQQELPIIDMTVQMFTNPQLIGDTDRLLELQHEEEFSVECTLQSLDITVTSLRSTALFKSHLEEQGVEIEYKNGTNGPIPCFAATDQFMRDLRDGENQVVAAIIAARMQVKSNIRGTRAKRLAEASGRGSLPVYLNYFGAARTGRWSGGDATNWQNFPRSGELGKCISAPEGHTLIIADAAQIECRILNYVAGQKDVIDAFRAGRDIYCEIASAIYNRSITKQDEAERFFGKKTELSCGYGIGKGTLYKRLRGEGVAVQQQQCDRAVLVYRTRHPFVTRMWREGDLALEQLRRDDTSFWLNGIIRIDGGYLTLPNSTRLRYALTYDRAAQAFKRTDRRGTSTIWGGALTGEVVQALAAVYLREVIHNVHARTGLKPVWLRHDEAVYISRDCDVELNLKQIKEEFCCAPSWLPDIPLDCEIWASKNYAK